MTVQEMQDKMFWDSKFPTTLMKLKTNDDMTEWAKYLFGTAAFSTKLKPFTDVFWIDGQWCYTGDKDDQITLRNEVAAIVSVKFRVVWKLASPGYDKTHAAEANAMVSAIAEKLWYLLEELVDASLMSTVQDHLGVDAADSNM